MKDFPSETPRLDPIPFVVADVLLVGTAALIGWQAEAPLGVAPLACISALVGLGAIAGLYPFVVNHARKQEEALHDRANQIEALARTVGASAEQISIAVANLPVIAENAARQLKVAEQLPAELQARLASLQHQLSATASEENAALRHELDTLRGAETNKLAAALDGLAHATADLARLETLAAKHASALDAALTHLPRVADSFGQQAGEILRRETTAAAGTLNAAATEAGRAIADATQAAREALARSAQEIIAQLGEHADKVAARTAVLAAAAPAVVPAAPASATAPVASVAQPAAGADLVDQPATEPVSAKDAPKPVEVDVDASELAGAAADDASVDEDATEDAATVAVSVVDQAGDEANDAADAEADDAAEDASVDEAETGTDETAPDEALAAATERNSAEESATDEGENETGASSPGEEAQDAVPEAAAESALSHDGYTRLIATAYIGIGNKLFIRGDGPGLRTDKGVPLQFVSIGKWRWESAELLFPAKVKLYKNDTVECTKLGEFMLEPGHHHEVNATF